MKRKGVSLIVLVITIVVIIILAAALVLALNQNNPIQTSRVATISQTRDNLQSAVVVYLGNVHTKTLGDYSAEELLIQNDSYKIVEETAIANKVTIENDGNNINLYKLDVEKVKSFLNIEIKNESKSAWYMDKNGIVYLVYDSDVYIPEYYKENGSLLSTLSSFVVPASKKINIENSLFVLDTGIMGVTVTVYRDLPFDKTLIETGFLALNDGSLGLDSSVAEVNRVLNLNCNSASILKRVCNNTARKGSQVKAIQELGHGVWLRGYAEFSDGTVLYTDTVYSNVTNQKIRISSVNSNSINFEVSRNLVETIAYNSQSTALSVVNSGIIYVNDGTTLTENSTVAEANEVLVIDSTNSNVVKETNASTLSKDTFNKEITDSGDGVWARGYVTIDFGGNVTKTVYTNSIYKKK